MILPGKVSTIGLSIGAIAVCVITYVYVRRNRRSRIPKEIWKHIGSIKEIALYPIKSSSAVELEEADCDSYGLHKFNFHDRRLVLIHDVDKKIASVGRFPLMLSIKINIISPGCLQLTAPNVEPLALCINDITAHDGKRVIKQMKGYSLELFEGLPEHHAWFSRVIIKRTHGMRLYFSVDPIIETSWWRETPNEFMPVMVMHDKSIQRVNSKIEEKNQAHHQQFRGNLLIESIEKIRAFDEDRWLWMKCGNDNENYIILRFKSACLRCIIPNIDIFSCKRNEDFEPLKTLKRMRLRDHPTDPEMGIYFDVYKEGVVKCGDPVYVQYK